MSRRAAEYKRTSLSGEERKARLKQRCMEDVAAKRSKLIRSLRNAPGSVSQVGHSIVEAMQSECAAVDPEDPHAGLTEGEYQEIMVSLEDALMTLVVEEERVAKEARRSARSSSSEGERRGKGPQRPAEPVVVSLNGADQELMFHFT